MNIAIIGGGASGMLLASMIEKHKVTLFEKNSKLGKKLLLTGNGKCNFTNKCFDNINKIYNSEFAIEIYNKFDNISFINYLYSIGVETEVNIHKGIKFCYPKTNKSISVYYALLDKINNNNVSIKLNTNIKDIIKINDKFLVYTESDKYEFDIVIISTGGMSYSSTGSTGDGYIFAKKFGHNIIKLLPALSGYRINKIYLGNNKGVRINTKVSAINSDNKEEIAIEYGEVQFSDDSISGYPIMNLSRIINRDIDNGVNIEFILDLTYGINDFNDVKYLIKRKKNLHYRKKRDFLSGVIDDSIINYIFEKIGIKDLDAKVSEFSDYELGVIYDKIHNFDIKLVKNLGFDCAQLTIGGIDTNEINNDTLESKKVNGLYFIGEVMDVDGKCGGYNLQICYSSASIVNNSIGG